MKRAECSAHPSLRDVAGQTVMASRDEHTRGESEHLTADANERAALDRVFSLAYEELRRLAASVRRNDPGATISATTLVNEAWLRLAATPSVAQTSPLHFKRIAARAMRQVLVDVARRRHADKRGGMDAMPVTLEDALLPTSQHDDILSLDAALDDLARLNPRQAQMVECRFFGGLDVMETAALLGISEATVLRDWRAARAWLAAELRDTP